ncbi:hypothetical protein D6D19_10670 [Aureobasidium pullulans]|uniref:DNA-directed DNA polymerase n=1 Tax=Aureobasidium pullulans TaxID=5580 RepID=A0A4S8YX28_AURPU|nr:hypothetical protein D6D19_10670 [Aureobasidium pullulans]
MVNTNVDNIMDAMKIGNDFKKSVNERYELLEIDIDNIFRRLLLHAKKKYAAVNMIEKDGKWIDKLEVKGLDMRRREYCALSKDTSTELLNFLLSGEDPETVVSQIHDHLREVASQMRANTIPLRKYTIYTQLGKNPKEYPNGNSMPSVQVALKLMAKGKHVKAKDVMSYIICNDSSGSAEKAAKNAFPVDEVLRAENELKPDIDYYLHKQILPPVERLCAPIEGTNVSLLAECLGLDTSKYRVSSASGGNNYNAETEIHPLESQVPDEIRYKDCQPLGLMCLSCRTPFQFRGLGVNATPDAETRTAKVENDGIHCPADGCGAVMPQLALAAQLESQIRAHTAQYYAATLVCDEATCGNRTRQMSVYGHRCLGPRGLAFGCNGKMQLEYSEKQLYNQLMFLGRCFDVEKSAKEAEKKKSEEGERVGVLAEMNRGKFGVLRGVVEGYLDKNDSTPTEANDRQDNECLICWSSPSLTLHCNHTFCFPCLDSYFTTHKSKHSCPVCSSPLFRPTLFTSENLNIWCNKLRTVLSILILLLYFLRAISCACILPTSSILAWAKCSISAGNTINWIEIAIKEIPYLVVSVLQVWAQRKMVRMSGVEWAQGELKAADFVAAVGWVQKVGGMVWGVETIARMAGRVGWKRLVG